MYDNSERISENYIYYMRNCNCKELKDNLNESNIQEIMQVQSMHTRVDAKIFFVIYFAYAQLQTKREEYIV